MRKFSQLIVGSLLFTITVLISCSSGLSAMDKERVTDLASRAKAVLARDEDIKARRKALDDEVSKILEREQVAAIEAERASAVSQQNDEQRRVAVAANIRWKEAREQMRTQLKDMEPRIAEIVEAEKAITADKENLQADARIESDKISRGKKNSKP